MKITSNYVNIAKIPGFKAEKRENPAQTSQKEQIPVPMPTMLAYMLYRTQNASAVNVKFYNAPTITELAAKYDKIARQDISELAKRAGQSGQVLNWIGVLSAEQLNRIDEIYNLAESMKKDGKKKLGIIGIGGSKHTIENLLGLTGKNDNIVFLSAVDPQSMDKFISKLGDLENASIMVASKSGTTLEPSTGYVYVEKKFIEKFKKDYIQAGMSENDAQKAAEKETAKHFTAITDKNPDSSTLRKIAGEKGYKTGIIHDDCGGRFGAFDDHALVALAWAGMEKEDMKKMLTSAQNAQKKFLSSNISQNFAAQRALFNANCIINGQTNQYDYYFGDSFEGTKLWNTQMKKESHKSLYKAADLIGPEFLHNSAESDLDSGNTTSFYTFNIIKNDGSAEYKPYNALISGSLKAYSKNHPVSLIELKDLSPETIGEFIELKHFEAMYTGMFLRSLKGEKHPQILPEVEQPNVKIYKDEVESILKNN